MCVGYTLFWTRIISPRRWGRGNRKCSTHIFRFLVINQGKKKKQKWQCAFIQMQWLRRIEAASSKANIHRIANMSGITTCENIESTKKREFVWRHNKHIISFSLPSVCVLFSLLLFAGSIVEVSRCFFPAQAYALSLSLFLYFSFIDEWNTHSSKCQRQNFCEFLSLYVYDIFMCFSSFSSRCAILQFDSFRGLFPREKDKSYTFPCVVVHKFELI